MRVYLFSAVILTIGSVYQAGCADSKSSMSAPVQAAKSSARDVQVEPAARQATAAGQKRAAALKLKIGERRASFYEAALVAMGEGPLVIFPSSEAATVRLLLYPWMHHPVAIRVERRKEAVTVVTKWLRRKGGPENSELVVSERRAASIAQFNELERLLAIASFWSLGSKSKDKKLYYRKEERMLLEGVSGEIYHAVELRVPLGDVPLRRVREFLLEISGDWRANKRLLEQFRK